MIVKVFNKSLKHLTKASRGSACIDISANETRTVWPMERVLIKTGIHMSFPKGTEVQIRPRSGLALKHGITVLNAPGTIDSDYRDELGVIIINLGAEPYTINKGDRIAQLSFVRYTDPVLISVTSKNELDENDRGGGFGSSGD